MKRTHSNSKILIIDDQIANTQLLEGFLKLNNYNQFKSINDSRDAESTISEYLPDLLLLDIMMPHISGIDILQWMKGEGLLDSPMRVMVLTADITKETLKDVLSIGAHDILRKPFDFVELQLRIKNLLHSNDLIKKLSDQAAHLEELVVKRTNELSLKNEELEQFIYVASHDTQEPLRMIHGFLQLLEKKYNNKIDDKGKEYIHYAMDGANRMKLLIKDMLDFSRADRLVIKDLELVPMKEVVDDVMLGLSRIVQESHAKLEIETLPDVIAPPTPLRQVLQNLIINGIIYQPSGQEPKIHIYSKESKDEVIICVEDNGIGIDKENQKKIFDIFTRLHRKEEYPGSGIGLSITKKLMEKMGGSIVLESSPGNGSTFMLHFPKKLQD